MNLEELKAAYRNSTQGEWVVDTAAEIAVITTVEEKRYTRVETTNVLSAGCSQNWGYVDVSEADRDFMILAHNAMPELIARIGDLEVIVQRVRDLHPMVVNDEIEATWCGTCTPKDGAGNYVVWDTDESAYPCPTIQALGDTK